MYVHSSSPRLAVCDSVCVCVGKSLVGSRQNHCCQADLSRELLIGLNLQGRQVGCWQAGLTILTNTTGT